MYRQNNPPSRKWIVVPVLTTASLMAIFVGLLAYFYKAPPPDRKLSLVWLLVVSFQLVSLRPLDLHWFLRVPLVLLGMLGQRLVWAMIRQW